MLPRYYRFTVHNAIGQNAAIVVTVRRKKFDANGALEYEAAAGGTEVISQAALATASYASSTAQDNGTDKYLGLEGTIEVTGSSTPNGNVTLFFERSHDGTDWPTNGLGTPIAVLNITNTTPQRVDFEL